MSDETEKLADDVVADDLVVGASAAASPSEDQVDESVEASEGASDSSSPEAGSLEAESASEVTDSEVVESEVTEAETAVEEAAEAEGVESASDAASDESDDAESEGYEEDGEEDSDGELAEDDADEDGADEDGADEDGADEVDAEPIEVAEPDSEEIKMDWYILKVQSNREKSITAALKRKIAVEGLEDYFGDVVVPVEKVTEFKGGKKKVVNRKLYPGYIVVHMHINDDTWFAVRETSGIGDFTGSGGKPTPMLPSEVARIIQTEEEEAEDAPKLNINFKIGDRVKVNDGNFESFEGEVNSIDEHSGRITVMINIFGRSTPVELEYWQVEQV